MRARSQAIPRYRTFRGPALFSQGFRPFFLAAGLWALVAMALWLPTLQGSVVIPTAFSPVGWHAHEMIFGFAVAAVAGFTLTAIPNWTGRMPLQGGPLALLFAAWLLGRLAVLLSAFIGAGWTAVIDLSFLAVLLIVVVREIVAGRNWRNLPVPAALAGLLLADVLIHVDAAGRAATGAFGVRLATAVVILLIGLVGGRIIPSFTRNWLSKRGEARMPAGLGSFDRLCLVALAVALGSWAFRPEGPVSGGLLVVAGVTTLARLARWRGHRTLREPLVWSLHLGFAWVPLGLLLVGASGFSPGLSTAAGLHALTAGAMGSMTLAVMTRAILSHTGQASTADWATGAIYLAVSAGAALRVAAPFLPGAYPTMLWASGLLWILAFAIFSVRYGRILLSR